jgi:hypothetical protein
VSCINQNLNVMGVASCRSAFLCLMSRVRLVLFRISVHNWISFNGRACRGFRSVMWPSPAQPGPIRPGPRAPGAPALPLRPPLPQICLAHLILPAQQPLSLSHPSLSLSRGALGFGDGDRRSWITGGEFFPSPSLLLSLPLPPLLFPARALPFSPARASPPRPPARRRLPLSLLGAAARPCPSAARRPAPALPAAARRVPAPAPCAAAALAPAPPRRGGARPCPPPLGAVRPRPCPMRGGAATPPLPLPRGGGSPLPLPAVAPAPAPPRGDAPRPQRGPPAPCSLLGAAALPPGAAAPAPARGVPVLVVARVASARPRAPPFTPNAFPRAQPHVCGDYPCFFS